MIELEARDKELGINMKITELIRIHKLGRKGWWNQIMGAVFGVLS
jgi:hypothetical protein